MDALLNIKDMTKRLGGFTLGPISMEVPAGAIVGLIGSNGAGKTPLLTSALGLLKPTGTVELLPDTPAKRDVRQDLGIVLGDHMFPGDLRCAQISRLMKMIYDHWDEGHFYWLCKTHGVSISTDYKDMSTGTRKMLNLIIALSHAPKLLILDEPAANLDPVARDAICDLLFEFTRDEGHGVLVSSHILSDLERVCDYIAFLHNGRLLFCQEKDLLLEQFGIYNCTEEDRKKLPPEAIRGLRHNQFGEEVLLDRKLLPHIPTRPASMEDIMVLMVKGMEK